VDEESEGFIAVVMGEGVVYAVIRIVDLEVTIARYEAVTARG